MKWRSIYRSQPNAVVQIFAKTLCYKNHLGLDARKPVFMSFGQHRRRPACASAQTDQHLCYSLFGKHHICTCYKRIFNFLVSLCSWGDWFESSLVGNREDRFSCDDAHLGQLIIFGPYRICIKAALKNCRCSNLLGL